MSPSSSDDENDGAKRRAAAAAVHRLTAAAEAEIADLAKRVHPSAGNAHRLQLLTRQQRKFSELEAALPDRTSTWGFATSGGEAGAPLSLRPSSIIASGGRLWRSVSKASGQSSKVADLLSYFGNRNPAPQPITDKDCVWLLDNVAFVDPATGEYHAEYVVAVMAQHPTCKVVDAVRAVADKLGHGAEDDDALKTIEERITPFLQDILPGRQVAALHGRDWELQFSPGGRNGLSSDIRRLPGAKPGTLVPTTAQVPKGVNGMLQMQTFFVADTSAAGAKASGSEDQNQAGKWGVISDIDDTIKLTQTSDPIGILQKTFVDPATPIHGMPQLYKYVQSLMGDAAPFFYLSASPYNLYPFLHKFRRNFYPHGMLVLRDATLMSVSGLLSTLTLGTQAYKVDRMHKIHRWLPDKTFVCVGDSTQSDPEAYGEIYRAYPGWVGLILIRKVTDIAALGMEEKNEDERFEKAFEGVPKDKWHVFEDPRECYALVQKAVGTGSEAEAVAAAAAAALETKSSAPVSAQADDDEMTRDQ